MSPAATLRELQEPWGRSKEGLCSCRGWSNAPLRSVSWSVDRVSSSRGQCLSADKCGLFVAALRWDIQRVSLLHLSLDMQKLVPTLVSPFFAFLHGSRRVLKRHKHLDIVYLPKATANSLERLQLASTGFGPVSQGKDANFGLQSAVPSTWISLGS